MSSIYNNPGACLISKGALDGAAYGAVRVGPCAQVAQTEPCESRGFGALDFAERIVGHHGRHCHA